MTRRLRPIAWTLFATPWLVATAACGGGGPLMHPARTLPKGDVRVVGGVSANVATGSLGDDLRKARDLAAKDPGMPGAPGTNADYTKGALVSAAVAPGLAPLVGGRVGLGSRFEGGLAYTGRGVRVDLRRSYDDGRMSYSAGLGLSAVLYGRRHEGDLPNVDRTALRGYGADLPLLVGWESTGGLYKIWGGVRGGYEHYAIEAVTSEPGQTPSSVLELSADRTWGGGVFGLATGLGHLHVGLELSAAYQVVSGRYNDTRANVRGFTLAPATALWWTF